jgi:hypothetical protein
VKKKDGWTYVVNGRDGGVLGKDLENKGISKQIRRCFSVHGLNFLVKNTTVHSP